ncbi:hypothetical protein MNBD_GAMMA24-1348 [hydrothermal vent metagenome]|uniref:Uncharacterized protein n=1 Tax=hydrothermal vent metagenome TaxID=652676 RepID=A0A3B1B3E2_9ZZZZ
MRACLLLCFLTGWILTAQASQPLKRFTTGSYQAILHHYQDKPFVLVLWSLDCPPCYEELEMLANFRKQQPYFNLLLVSIDGVEAKAEAQDRLYNLGLLSVENWIFTEAVSPQLLDQIDPSWYGVVPRSYLFDASHDRQAITGLLRIETLQAWLKKN